MMAPRPPDIFFTPTPARVVEEMLRLAEVGPRDVVFDLGCGDGQIVLAAARNRGARGVGVEIDAALVALATERAMREGVADLVRFVEQDIFETELREASVIALYLLDSLNVRLRPRILAQCAPGTRVVSYSFEMGEWEPDAHTPMAVNGVSLWVVPASLGGTWRARETAPGEGLEALELEQVFQKLSGAARVGGEARRILEGRVLGRRFRFSIADGKAGAPLEVSGELEEGGVEMKLELGANKTAWRGQKTVG